MSDAVVGALRQRLISLLEAEAAQMQLFVDVLEEERAALGQADVEPLFVLAERKNALAGTLQQLATRRAELLAQAGQPHSREGIEALIKDSKLPAWQAFNSAARQARDLNDVNGVMISERLKNNHQALAILMRAADQPAVYGPDGQSRPKPGSRLFGSA